MCCSYLRGAHKAARWAAEETDRANTNCTSFSFSMTPSCNDKTNCSSKTENIRSDAHFTDVLSNQIGLNFSPET